MPARVSRAAPAPHDSARPASPPIRAAVPLAAPLPDSPHGASGQPPALGPAEPPRRTVGRTAAGARSPAGPPATAEQFGPVTATVPGAPT